MASLAQNLMIGFKHGAVRDGGSVKDARAKLLSTCFWCISLLLNGVFVSQFWNIIVMIHDDLPNTTPLAGVMAVLLSHLLFQRKIEIVGYSDGDDLALYAGKVMGMYFLVPFILFMVSVIALIIF